MADPLLEHCRHTIGPALLITHCARRRGWSAASGCRKLLQRTKISREFAWIPVPNMLKTLEKAQT
jgi:hypothetical protein